MPTICISGLSGSGKNAAGEALARMLGLRVISFSFKDEARRSGTSLMEIQKRANASAKMDRALDAKIAAAASTGNCVVTTWLGPWFVKNAYLRVWLKAGERERAKRISVRDKMPFASALAHVRKRDADNIKRYKKYYKIDITNHDNFDLIIDSSRFAPGQIAKIIAAAPSN